MRKTGNNYSGSRHLFVQREHRQSNQAHSGGLTLSGSSRKPRVLDTSTGRRGRLVSEAIHDHGVIKTVRWDDGAVTREGDGNPDIIVLRD